MKLNLICYAYAVEQGMLADEGSYDRLEEVLKCVSLLSSSPLATLMCFFHPLSVSQRCPLELRQWHIGTRGKMRTGSSASLCLLQQNHPAPCATCN